MEVLDDVITEFDEKRRIFHLTSKRPLNIKANIELTDLCNLVKSRLSEYAAEERCYMIVDVNKIVIDPMLTSEYMQKLKILIDHFLYPEGLARYGYQITRVTATIGHQRYFQNNPNLFRNKAEAMAFIEGLIKSRQQGKQHSTAAR